MFTSVFIVLLTILILIPTGFEKQIYVNAEGVKAKVISINNSGVYNTGIINQGDQSVTIEIQTGTHKGEVVEGKNLLTGKLEFDKFFSEGDDAWVLLEFDEENNIIFANMVDHYRINVELILIGLFALMMIIFSGFTGVRTLLSFTFALLSIWKILIPFMLRGYNPLIIALIVGNVLTVVTLFLVAGFTKKATAAIISSVACSMVTCLLAIIFSRLFNMHGAVMQWSESLLYAGYSNLI